MKKISAVIAAAVLCALLFVSASAVVNSNHLIDEGFPRFNGDESEWDVYGWTVVDTKITALGYKLDGADAVWVDESVDVRDNAAKVEANDCFEDMELERAIIEMDLTNGLEEFYGYRMHITLDTTGMAKGVHMLEAVVRYEDGTTGNPMRDTAIEINKTKAPASGDGQKTDEGKADDPKTEEPKTEEPKAIDPKPNDNPGTSDASVIALASVAAIAFAGIVIAKKIK